MSKKIKVIIAIVIALLGMLIMISKLFDKQPVINTIEQTTLSNEGNTTISSTNITTKKKTTKKVVKTTKKAKKKTTGFNIKASKSEMQNYARQYIGNDDEYEAFDYIITRESYWNANAVNKKSGASGLCQSLPASKMASAGKDYKTNYKTQIHWCVSYCRTRYGSIKKAKQYWLKHHWF